MALTEKIASRFIWALELLDIQPDDRILEIGCGHGIAVSVIGDMLDQGRVTAIDRSYDMVELARQKNQGHLKSGKAVIQPVSLDRADFGDERFDRIFAINVSLFEQQADRGLDIVKRALVPGGRLFVIFQPPNSSNTSQLADRTIRNLEVNGFTIERVSFKDLDPATAMCVEATVA
ncbi:MAG: methyltransferase domain-containing protein [Chloroflexota bacterium]|nr:methyltransferase domain-containing protein [Chloroflexota bacterium]